MKKGKMTWMSGVAVIAMVTAAQAAVAGDLSGADKPLVLAQNVSPSNSTMSNAELAARLQAVEDQLAAQQERAMADRTRLSTLEQGYNSALWNFDNGRASFASGDGRFTLAIRARMQADFAGFSQDAPGSHPAGFAGPTDLSSGAVMRRAYFGIEGKAYNDFWYEIRLNAGGSDGGQNSTCTATTTISTPPGGTATTTCALGSIEPAGEGDPLLDGRRQIGRGADEDRPCDEPAAQRDDDAAHLRAGRAAGEHDQCGRPVRARSVCPRCWRVGGGLE